MVKIVLQCCFDKHGNFDNYAFTQLSARLNGMITGIIRKYYLPGGDYEDLYQCGLLGLYKAVLYYNENGPYSFDFVARKNIQNVVKTAVTGANRQKHKLANEAESLYVKKFKKNGDGVELIDHLVINDQISDPSHILIEKETTQGLYHYINHQLSEHERMSILLYIHGYKQQDIAKELRIHRKVVDNAIQRAKKKLLKYVIRQNEDRPSSMLG